MIVYEGYAHWLVLYGEYADCWITTRDLGYRHGETHTVTIPH